jgi:hypothetical protein
MAFQSVTTCSNFVIISQTEYSFLSQQSAMFVRKRAGFLSPYQRAGASSNSNIYLGNSILCIFRQLLKYPCFNYSFLDNVKKYQAEILDSPS